MHISNILTITITADAQLVSHQKHQPNYALLSLTADSKLETSLLLSILLMFKLAVRNANIHRNDPVLQRDDVFEGLSIKLHRLALRLCCRGRSAGRGGGGIIGMLERGDGNGCFGASCCICSCWISGCCCAARRWVLRARWLSIVSNVIIVPEMA
jgi:hypothetical protein